jgi:hypothetical protein
VLDYEEDVWDCGGINSFILNSAIDEREQSPSCSGPLTLEKLPVAIRTEIRMSPESD